MVTDVPHMGDVRPEQEIPGRPNGWAAPVALCRALEPVGCLANGAGSSPAVAKGAPTTQETFPDVKVKAADALKTVSSTGREESTEQAGDREDELVGVRD
ncbi:MAG: hypothetical protein WA830_05735 [Candidatus Sulfotelmatobacter sp.]